MADDQTQIIRIVIDASKAKDGADESRRHLESIEGKVATINDTLAKMGDSVAGAFGKIKATLLGFFSFEAIKAQIDSLIGSFDKLGSRAATLGVGTQWLQAFEFAAASSSVKLDVANTALEKFSRLIGEAALGNKAAVQTVNDLGLKIFDAQRQLRPTNDLFEEAAKKLSGMDSAAKQNALSIQAMGKTAQQAVPMLEAVGKGSEYMLAGAQKAGAVASQESIKIWEELASAADKSMIQWRAFAGENFATTVKRAFDDIAAAIRATIKEVQAIAGLLEKVWSGAKDFAREQNANNARGGMAAIDDALPGAMYRAEAANRSLASSQRSQALSPTGARSNLIAQQQQESQAAAAAVAALQGQRTAIAGRIINYQVGTPDSPAGVTGGDFGAAPPKEPGGTVGAYGATELDRTSGDRQNKRIELLKIEAAAQHDMAEAAKLGTAAVAEQEAKLKALQQALEVYGDKAKATDPAVQSLAAAYKKLNEQISNDKALTAFRLQTEDMERQNLVLAKRVELFGQAPEVIARELAAIQAKNEAEKSGAKLTQEDLDTRTKAVEKQELMNIKLQEAQKTQELWLQPLKQALNSMQSSLANMFEQLFTGGINSWQQFTDSMKKIWIRMIAELAAASVIRPILAPIVQGGVSAGIVSPGVASQLGYGTGSAGTIGGGGMPSLGGGSGGGLGMPSMGGTGGGMFGNLFSGSGGGFGSIFDGSAFQTAVPSAASGAMGPQIPGALSSFNPANGFTMGSFGMGNLSGAVGVGMGAYGLATDKKPTTASTIGHIGSMVGGALMMIPTPYTMAAGAVISLASAVLPSLFGGDEYKWDPLAGANVAYNWNAATGSYGTADTQQQGGKSIAGQFKSVPSTLEGLYKAAGGKVNPAMAFNAAIWNNQREGTTSAYVISPTQGSNQIGQTSGDPSALISKMIGNVFTNMVTNGGLSGVSPTLQKALRNREAYSVEEATSIVELTTAYDNFGKGVNKAKPVLDQVTASFEKMTATATTFGLALEPIAAEQEKQTKRTAQDFIDNMLNPLAVQMRALEDQQKDALASAQYIKDNVTSVYVDMAKIAEYYTRQEAALRQQFYASEISNLQTAIQQLTYGGLSGASPVDTLSGARGTYAATLAQAQAGDRTAIGRLASDATAYVSVGKNFYGSSQEYADLIAQVRAALADEMATLQTGGPGTPAAAATEASQAVVQSNLTLSTQVAAQNVTISNLNNQLADLAAQLQRLAVNMTR